MPANARLRLYEQVQLERLLLAAQNHSVTVCQCKYRMKRRLAIGHVWDCSSNSWEHTVVGAPPDEAMHYK